MRVVILPDPDSVADFAANELSRQIHLNPYSVLGLATGGTPLGVYQRLTDSYRRGQLSFHHLTTFNLDEYVGLSSDHPQSYRQFMEVNLFAQTDIAPAMTHIPRGIAEDLPGECCEYEAHIRAAGGIDLQLLGIGTDGHIAFNEPGSSLASRTRIKTLTERTRRDNARFFGDIDSVPRTAITMGIGTILEAKQILLLATGIGKTEAVRAMVEGPVSSFVPASALQLHPLVTVVIDNAAADLLEHKTYYRQSEEERQRLRNE